MALMDDTRATPLQQDSVRYSCRLAAAENAQNTVSTTPTDESKDDHGGSRHSLQRNRNLAAIMHERQISIECCRSSSPVDDEAQSGSATTRATSEETELRQEVPPSHNHQSWVIPFGPDE